jgi:tRNA 2-thiouridine synthesizing protein A
MTDNHPDEQLDVTGLLCPLPVLKAAKRLKSLSPGQTLHLVVTDPMAAIDVPHFCAEQGHELLSSKTLGSELHFRIRKVKS